jgi:Mrp family chromosome partitioning ATPase
LPAPRQPGSSLTVHRTRVADCPGTESKDAGKASACEGCPNRSACAGEKGAGSGPDPDLQAIADRLRDVKHIVMVLSGKGGVGKSTVSTQVALSLAAKGLEVGLLDIDVCGPSVPRMLGLEDEEIHQSNSGWSPVYFEENLGVMSIGFMLSKRDDAIIWRGPKKNALIKQFLKDVDWGALDYLIIDAPPGTSDEHITAAHCLLPCNLAGAVIVTTPQEVALLDVKKEINFCKKTGIRVLGVVENMSGFVSPTSALEFFDASGSSITEAVQDVLREKFGAGVRAEGELLFAERGAAERMAGAYGVPFLGKVPMDLEVSRAAEHGVLCVDKDGSSPAGAGLHRIAGSLVLACETKPDS